MKRLAFQNTNVMKPTTLTEIKTKPKLLIRKKTS